jgi:hypothetical protein
MLGIAFSGGGIPGIVTAVALFHALIVSFPELATNPDVQYSTVSGGKTFFQEVVLLSLVTFFLTISTYLEQKAVLFCLFCLVPKFFSCKVDFCSFHFS